MDNLTTLSLEERALALHKVRLHRNWFLFNIIAKSWAWPIVKLTSSKYYEIPEETQELMRRQHKDKDSAIFYVASHKSMWEALGIPYAISWHDGDIPYIMMGNNLIKKEKGWKEATMKYVGDRSGLISVEREINPKMATPVVISDIDAVLSAFINNMTFPESTRSKNGSMNDFKPAAFQGAVQAAAKGVRVDIVPVNVDYSHLIESKIFAGYNEAMRLESLILSNDFRNMTRTERLDSMRNIYYYTSYLPEKALRDGDVDYSKIEKIGLMENVDYKKLLIELNKAYTFKFEDMKYWRVNLGEVYISFGKPMPVEARVDDKHYRGELAEISRTACLDLVKIQKINVLAEAMVRLDPGFGEPIYDNELYREIIGVMKDYEPHADKFRGFTMYTKPAEIVKSAKKSDIKVNSRFLEEYKIHANNTKHYLSNI